MNQAIQTRRGGDILTIGFATTVAMWALMHVAAIPPGILPVWLVALALVGVMLVAGYVAGRRAGRGWRGGAAVGGLVSGTSLLIVLSLLGGDQTRDSVLAAVWWIIGFFLTTTGLGALGAAIGKRLVGDDIRPVNWTCRLAGVTAITILMLIIAGGIVTGLEAGLAVKGWLVAEGHPMVLFPLSLMRRDVGTFAEHAHRLWGLLVGLTVIVLTIHLWLVDRRRWLRWLAVAVVLAVIAQGTLGGTRVTEQSILLAIVHGVLAPVILAVLVAVIAATSTAWGSDFGPGHRTTARTDRTLSVVLVALVLVQIVAGTLFRHLQPTPGVSTGALMGLLHGHSFVGSMLVVVMALLCGVRAWGRFHDEPMVRRSGIALIYIMTLQVMLGIGSFIVVPHGARDPGAAIPILEVALTSAHQVTGAILLATATLLFVWIGRVLAPNSAAGHLVARGPSTLG